MSSTRPHSSPKSASDAAAAAVRGDVRYFTTPGVDPAEAVEWQRRDARIVHHGTGRVVFEQTDVEFPAFWSQNATDIVTQKYFRGQLGHPDREHSLRDVIARIVDTITAWGHTDGHLDDPEAFAAELTYLLIHQRASFNSPVWFNIGVPNTPQQASACFILSVDDSIDSILEWYRQEAVIFKGGSGAGVNLSRIRSSAEPLTGGGSASGPVSFMRGADASAGTIKSGGKTRRAAKMVILDVDHPDIEEFVDCKAIEERKARVLAEAGFDMGLDGTDIHSVQYQNANNSVRVTDEFMHAVVADAEWPLRTVTTGETVRTVRARELLQRIAAATWECADPGIQYDTTINAWHTASATGRINASNPCSEYMHLDDSACNLASLNLLTFLREDGTFDVDGFRHSVAVMLTAQEILVGRADYPTERIGETSRRFRQLGLGYANLGALLMASGLPYDSEAGRATAAAITALMTGHAYAVSADMARRLGPFDGFDENRAPMLDVLGKHRGALDDIDADLAPADVLDAARQAWDRAVADGSAHGVRNSQVSVLAPTGTIGLAMDCDTTGIEPDLALVKTKKLVGGGSLTIVNRSVPRALSRLGYSPSEVADIVAHLDLHHDLAGAPHVRDEHAPVFATSMGDNVISPRGHVAMMAAVQPFLSGAISKTVNLPESATVDDIADMYVDAWRLGVKALAIYRDNCKLGQPLSTASRPAVAEAAPSTAPRRERLPRTRTSRTFEFRVADCKGFVTIGEYDDGRPGEMFLRVSKQGSTLAGIMDAFSMSVSYGLQYGVPLRTFVRAFTSTRFEPAGITDDPDLRIATSILDYIFRRLAIDYLEPDERAELGILTGAERSVPDTPTLTPYTSTPPVREPDPPATAPRGTHSTSSASTSSPGGLAAPSPSNPDAPYCMQCGVKMQRAGSCHACPSCGNTSGCS
ncbi:MULTISPECIES: vitamin B12-dependent ribonucleotide reductase [Rhodococcus]|uniref:vitamin B12-dependent ribonucleotide reductase n=1 Tax=Rhodococcus TaxID=1827 RepID=UPI001E4712E3|nr:vitamin B12-dependent ribonucleotide reductase [Rhodococcus pyridinivorans]MCD2116206.1 vitamin B12-dependent ribonucleotide reductase [Rhodococcus pyridinivorans]MCZ4625074.1 vitamin B12-dependent ribonucleotide reductase [Rhodococcus pyridinivorans]MCZ4646407.1 vitamin B12-dependent ribonucleotide reductase [Rhodococcus pyridinivorans]MDJ0481666.1 vitamin B12-dependent ribonucleotide reductase [Rhodococcus pyridinivorans]MDV7252387.1 vitamin B12-dependent ribonucleotide reductase [Rhodoco